MAVPSSDAQPAVAERTPAHIFVGNMDYQTKQSELKEAIEKLVGKTYGTSLQFIPSHLYHAPLGMMNCIWSVFMSWSILHVDCK